MRIADLQLHTFRVWVAVLLLFVPAQLDRVIAQDIIIPETTFTLTNGLTVVVSEDRSTPNVAVELWLRAGTRYEDRGRWGEAHFCEHLLGSTRLPTLRGRVLDGNAQTRRDFTRYYLLVPHEALEYALAAQADRLDYPLNAMTAKRLADNRDIVINEFRGNESRVFGFGSPTDVKVLVNGFGAQHPYGRPLQINSDVMTITDEDMRRWIAAHTLPSDAVLLRAGNVSDKTVVALASAVMLVSQPAATRTQTLIVVGQRMGELTSETFTRAQLASAMAGTRVNANLRDQHQWSYGAQGRLATASDGVAILVISSEVQGDQTAAAIAEIRRELEQHEPTAAELTRLPVYRRDLTQQISGSAGTVAGVNAALAQLARRGLPLATYPTLLRQAFDLDADSLREALRLIDAKVMVFVLVGDAAQVRPQLDAAGLAIITLPPGH